MELGTVVYRNGVRFVLKCIYVGVTCMLLLAGGGSGGVPPASTLPTTPPESAPPLSEFVVGGIDSDLGCTAAQRGGRLVRLGIALPELAAMTIDPMAGVGDEGAENGFLDRHGSVVNEAYPYWLAGNIDDVAWYQSLPEVCDAFTRFGRVIGYGHSYRGYPLDASEGHPELPHVFTMVHLFQTEAGAKAFMAWQPSAPWHAGSKPVVKPLDGAGADALVVSSTPKWGRVEVALMRRGRLVGEAFVSGPGSWTSEVKAATLAVAQAAKIESVTVTGQPFDVVQIMSAPLTLLDWHSLKSPGVYPELMCFEACSGDWASGADPWPWRYDARTWTGKPGVRAPGLAPDVTTPPRRSLLGVYGTILWVDEELPAGGTELAIYQDQAAASDALQEILRVGLVAPGGQLFDVPGLDGAVGLRYWTPPEDPDDRDFIGYTWNVFFTHGLALARAFIAGGPGSDDEEDSEPEAASQRNNQWAIDAATAWHARLDHVLS
jgi:hypothetical protein